MNVAEYNMDLRYRHDNLPVDYNFCIANFSEFYESLTYKNSFVDGKEKHHLKRIEMYTLTGQTVPQLFAGHSGHPMRAFESSISYVLYCMT
jgi:hypothetical protein